MSNIHSAVYLALDALQQASSSNRDEAVGSLLSQALDALHVLQYQMSEAERGRDIMYDSNELNEYNSAV